MAIAAFPNAVYVKQGEVIGDCVTDQFSVSTNGGMGGSPIICGKNSGYHMILDVSGSECQKVNVNIGSNTDVTRQWDVKITQYSCSQSDEAGWPGCLQYYTATSGQIQNFGFPTGTTAITSKTTHLSSQLYDICIRRGSGYCYICYSQFKNGPMGSFGLSISSIAISMSSVSSLCTNDYVIIPNANTAAIAAIANTPVVTDVHRFCGRTLATTIASTIGSSTVCSRSIPFKVSVNFDANEMTSAASIAAMELLAEIQVETGTGTGGIVGFKLNYFQVAC